MSTLPQSWFPSRPSHSRYPYSGTLPILPIQNKATRMGTFPIDNGIGREIDMERYDDIDASTEFDQLVSYESLSLCSGQTCTPSSHRRKGTKSKGSSKREDPKLKLPVKAGACHTKTFSTSTLSLNSTFYSNSSSHSHSRTNSRPPSYDFLDSEREPTPLSPSVTNSVIFSVPFEVKTPEGNDDEKFNESNSKRGDHSMNRLQKAIDIMEGNVVQMKKDETEIQTVIETMIKRISEMDNAQIKLSEKSIGAHKRYLQLAMNRRQTELKLCIRAKYNTVTLVNDKQKELYRLQMTR